MDNKIRKAIEELNKLKKDSYVSTASYIEKLEGLPTGIESIDMATGIGGLPIGRISEFHGLPGVGKTSLSLQIISHAQALGKTCLFVDAEHAFDITHAEGLGVDVDNLIIARPVSGEDAFETIEQLISKGAIDVVVVDSIPSLNPTPELEAELGKPTMGGQARLITSALRRLVPIISRNNATVVLINQMRVNIMGGQYDPYTIPGGKALQFYSSLRLELKRVGFVKKGDNIQGIQIMFRTKKNKCSNRNDTGEFTYLYDSGFSAHINVVEEGEKQGIITRNGNTYHFGDVKLGVGKEKSLDAVNSDPSLLNQLREALSLPPLSSKESSQ